MTDKLREAAQQSEREAFEVWAKTQGTPEQGWWFRQLPDGGYSSESPDAAWKAWKARAALAQQDAQACVGCNGIGMVGNILDTVTCPFCDGSGNAAPTPPAQQDAQWDPSGLYARGWINGAQVQSLIDWCNSGCAKRADVAFAGGSTRQMAYAIEHLVKRASNLETSEGVFVPRELLAKVANALGLPYEEEYTRLRSKLLDILSFAAPTQRVMLTDDEIDRLPWGPHEGNPMTFAEGLRGFAHAVIEAYERKNGKEVA